MKPPRLVIWRITNRCDLRCAHCASYGPAHEAEVMDTGAMLALADGLAELGCSRVMFSGGEPLLRRDWRQIAERLLEREVDVTFISNGAHFRDEDAEFCASAGISPVYFSLDGCEAVHDRQRRTPGAFRAAVHAIKRARRERLLVGVVTTVTRSVFPELEALFDELSELGISEWQVRLASRNGNDLAAGEYLDPQELPELMDRLLALARISTRPKVLIGGSIGYYGPGEVRLRGQKSESSWQGCGCGEDWFTLEPNGDVLACGNIPKIEGNAKETALVDLWNRPGAFSHARAFSKGSLEGECRDCSWAERCKGGCWALSPPSALGFRENFHCLQHSATGGPRYLPGFWNGWLRFLGSKRAAR